MSQAAPIQSQPSSSVCDFIQPSSLTGLYQDVLGCVLTFLPLSDLSSLLCARRSWSARDSFLVSPPRHPLSYYSNHFQLRNWTADHAVWKCRTLLRYQLVAVRIISFGTTPTSALEHLSDVVPNIRKLHLVFPPAHVHEAKMPQEIEWQLPTKTLEALWISLGSTSYVDYTATCLATSLPLLTRLTSLKFTCPPGIFSGLERLLDAVRVHPSLLQLSLDPFTSEMVDYLARPPHSLQLQYLMLPKIYPAHLGCGLTKIPLLTTIDSVEFIDLSCLSSFPALTDLRITFPSTDRHDGESDLEGEGAGNVSRLHQQSHADTQARLFVDLLPTLTQLRRLDLRLPAEEGDFIRKAFANDQEILLRTISRFPQQPELQLRELHICNYLLKFSILDALLRLPQVVSLQVFKYWFSGNYRSDRSQQHEPVEEGQPDEKAAPYDSSSRCLPQLTTLNVTHPQMTQAQFASVLVGLPALTDLRLSSSASINAQRHILSFELVSSVPGLADGLQILHLDRHRYQGSNLRKLFQEASNDPRN